MKIFGLTIGEIILLATTGAFAAVVGWLLFAILYFAIS